MSRQVDGIDHDDEQPVYSNNYTAMHWTVHIYDSTLLCTYT